MPRIFLPNVDEEIFNKNTTEQFAELGRFVVSFEAMVNEVRQASIGLLSKDSTHHGFIAIPFHHGAFTAKPLIEVWRAIVAELVSPPVRGERWRTGEVGIFPDDPPMLPDEDGNPRLFNKQAVEIFLAVLKVIQDEYESLANKRNNLLHATWFVGFPTEEDPNSAHFHISKFTTTKDGLSPLDLPKKADELKELSKRCDTVRDWVGWIDQCVAGLEQIDDIFARGAGKQWRLKIGKQTTLPQK